MKDYLLCKSKILITPDKLQAQSGVTNTPQAEPRMGFHIMKTCVFFIVCIDIHVVICGEYRGKAEVFCKKKYFFSD